jgi:hypothetical protein
LKTIISLIFTIGIFSFIILCGVLEIIILPSKASSYISNDQWITFITTYFSGLLGASLSIFGIGWQLDQKEIKERKRVEDYIRYILKKIDNEFLLEELQKTEVIISYGNTLCGDDSLKSEKIILLYEFNQGYINQNIDNILSLKNGEKIIELSEKIIKFNIQYSIYK